MIDQTRIGTEGIAVDPATPKTIVGIDRPTRRLLIATRQQKDSTP